MDTLRPYEFSGAIKGVQVKPLAGDGKKVRIRYNGSLVERGANEVFLNRGFGSGQEWGQVEEQPMEYAEGGFEQTVEMKNCQMNFCFRDSTANWDNNNGQNWIYLIK